MQDLQALHLRLILSLAPGHLLLLNLLLHLQQLLPVLRARLLLSQRVLQVLSLALLARSKDAECREVLFERLNLLLKLREPIVALPHLRTESLFNLRRRTFSYDPTTMHPNPSIMASTPPSQEDPEVLFELLKLLLKLREAVVALPHLKRRS